MNQAAASTGKFAAREGLIAVALGLTFAIVFFDRSAINILSPWIVADLGMTNAQLGFAASTVSLTWALAGYVAGRVSDATGRRKPYLLAAVVVFSLCSIASGLAGGFMALALIRLLMGLAEGPVPPLATAALMDASAPHRFGLNLAIYGLAGGVLAIAGPVILVGWAEAYGWRAAFFLAGVPGLVMAAVLAVVLREPRTASQVAGSIPAPRATPLLQLLRVRNIWLCAVIASLALSSIFISAVFAPLFLVKTRGLSPGEMAMLMTAVGLTVVVFGFGLTAASDSVGRKPLLILCGLMGVFGPIGCLWWTGGLAGMAVLLSLGALANVMPQFAIVMMPGESARPADRAAALGLVMGIAEVVGGFAAPAVAGLVADRLGLDAIPVMAGGCAVAAGALAFFLTETAPHRTGALLPHPEPA